MDKRMLRRDLALMTLLALLLVVLAAPYALADGVDTGTDRIEIAEDGTVTLVSGHMAGEGVASVQFQLRVEAGTASFLFSPALGERLTWCSEGDGVLNIYIAGSEPLMAEGVTSLVVGTVTGDMQNVQPVPESLGYVYGRRAVTVNAPEATRVDSLLEQLVQVLDDANTDFGAAHKYSDDSWGALNDAISRIEQLYDMEGLTQKDVDDAIAAYNTAKAGLRLAGKDTLAALLADAREVDGSQYTPKSYGQLQEAIRAAEAAETSEDGETVADAVQSLRAALLGLVEQQSADGPVGGIHGDGPDNGGVGGEVDSGDVRSDGPVTRQAEAPAGTDDAPAPEETDTAKSTPVPATDTPSPTTAPTGVQAPDTGDETALASWAALLVLSAGLLALCLRRARES